MNKKFFYKKNWVATLIFFLLSLTACASDHAHKNFLTRMQNQVGRNLDDPYIIRNRSSELRISIRHLSNGSTEEEFQIGRSCRVFFEIDNKEKKIIGWRYEGTKKECAIAL